jgi:molecular chaperone DnaK
MAEMPKAKAVQRASVAPPAPSAPPAPATQPSAATQQDPIRTHSMAKLLAAQGHTQRALAIYDELIVKTPWDEKLLQEAKELRNAAAASKPPAPVPATVVSVTPPAPATPTIPAKPAAVAAKSAAAVAKPAAVAAKPATAAAAAPALTPAAAAAALQSSATSRSSSFPAPARMNAPPLLLDVTPHTLAVETAGGYCEQVIERNSPIPTEQTRVFSTSRDNQTTVSMRVSQGEARRTDENQVLGQLELTNLREARRGEVSIAVTFIIDADGTLQVRAQDRATGRTQAIRVNLVGKVEDGEVERARARRGSARPAKK